MIRFVYIFLVFLFPSVSFYAQENTNKDFNKQLEKVNYLLFQTQRDSKQLEESLSILKNLYQQEESRVKSSKEDKNIDMMTSYAYALYYKAAYMFPREDEPNGKEYIDTRLKYYRESEKLADEMLEYKIDDKDNQAKIFFIAGLVKGEIASLNSSPFLIIKGRKLLEQALQANPNIRNGAIYLGLGRMYAKTPRILFGNKQKALELLKKAQDNFNPPSIVTFYFQADTILDDTPFKEASKETKILVLQTFLQGLEWEAKRIKIPYNKPNALTPEELDALKMMKHNLKIYGVPSNIRGLNSEIEKLIKS